ncbi:MAG TPA: aspartate--tRNA ligase [Clostridiales bacterium]|nr:aspartate--tRNA ligase [Clostridiales bacterium]
MEVLFKRTHMCGMLRKDDIGKSVVLNGWVQKRRNLGGLIFCDLRDKTGIVQIVFNDTMTSERFDLADSLRSEYVIGVKGTVAQRESVNEDLPTGYIEVMAEDLILYSQADTPPIYIKDDDNVSEDLRLKYRYLDLRKLSMQRNLALRHKLCKIARDYFDSEGFTEVETPILIKPTPEGARDYLVPSRVNHGKFYALPQSPQMFKQLLMLAGTDRYMQIARCFRDEDLRADRQPEFTQIDLEMSFVDQDDVLEIQERFLKRVFKELLDEEINLPLPRLTWKDAMERFGSDKPDLRFGFELKDLAAQVSGSEFKVFTDVLNANGRVMGIDVEGGSETFSRKDIDKMTESIRTFGASGLVWLRVGESEISSSVSKFFSQEDLQSIAAVFEAKVNDLILIVSGKETVVFDSLGFLRRDLAGKMGLLDDNDYKLLWVVDFPLLEYSEENARYMAKHHPFTSPKPEDIPIMDTDPGSVLANAYDIVLNGVELGGGSIRIHDRELQQKMFRVLQLTEDEIQSKFGYFLDAFHYGTPPHGGLAYGLDRMAMLLCKEKSIREVIAFPKNQNAVCAMSDAPTSATEEQLKELAITVTPE